MGGYGADLEGRRGRGEKKKSNRKGGGEGEEWRKRREGGKGEEWRR